jgi:hypothetical protein
VDDGAFAHVLELHDARTMALHRERGARHRHEQRVLIGERVEVLEHVDTYGAVHERVDAHGREGLGPHALRLGAGKVPGKAFPGFQRFDDGGVGRRLGTDDTEALHGLDGRFTMGLAGFQGLPQPGQGAEHSDLFGVGKSAPAQHPERRGHGPGVARALHACAGRIGEAAHVVEVAREGARGGHHETAAGDLCRKQKHIASGAGIDGAGLIDGLVHGR